MRAASIVITPKGSYYKMEKNDFRFNTENYKEVGEIVLQSKRRPSEKNGRLANPVRVVSNGVYVGCFEVFSDWSARELKN